MDRGDLSDAEWDLIGTLLSPERGRWARPAGENRRFLNGMLHVLRVGCPWRDMHERSLLASHRPVRDDVAAKSTVRTIQAHDKGLSNVTLADAYFGRAGAIIKQRERIKRQTIAHRRWQHRKLAA